MELSFWEQSSFLEYDALIIGAGIVGLSAAYFLTEKHPDWKIAVLERGQFPSGASTKNAGFACFGSISELIEQEKKAGKDGLYKLISRRWAGLQKLRNLLGDQHIGFENLGGYEVFDKQHEVLGQFCKDKIDYYNHLIKDITSDVTTYLPADQEINSLGLGNTVSLIKNKYEGQLDTGKMMFRLMQLVSSKGVLIFNNCEVTHTESTARGAKAYTSAGHFNCRHLLLATNGFTKQLMPELDVVPGRGQVLITQPIEGLKLKGTFHYEQGYYYFRNVGNRVLLGGGRNLDFETETTVNFGLTDNIQTRLNTLLKELILPGISFEIDLRWSGIMAFGQEIFPIIKEVQEHIYCGVRGSGMGVAMGTQTGADLATLCDR